MQKPQKSPASMRSPLDERTRVLVRNAIDEEHLRLLAIFHYVLGGFTMLTSCLFLMHFAMGIALALAPDFAASAGESGARWVGYLMSGFAGGLMLAGWIYGGLTIYAGRCLQLHKHRTFVMVMSAINCMQMPWGTLLGAFTIKVLLSAGVQERFRGISRKEEVAHPAPLPVTAVIAELAAEEEAMWIEMEKRAAQAATIEARPQVSDVEAEQKPEPEQKPEIT